MSSISLGKPISKERTIELRAIGAHWIRELHDGDDALTLSEVLVLLGSALGLAMAGLPPAERARLLPMVMKVAEKTAADMGKL